MKKLLLGVLLLPALAYPDPVKVDKEIICDETKVIISTLMKYKESPVWIGKDDISKYALLANEQTGSWTLVQFNDTIACIIGVGEGHKLIKIEPKSPVKSKIL